MKLLSNIFLVIAMSVLGSSAQSPAKILKRAEAALGGTKALQSVRSVVRKGTIKDSNGTEGPYLSQTAQPNLLNERLFLSGAESEIGYNGRSGWLLRSKYLKTLTDTSITDLQARANYLNNRWLNAKREKARLVVSGKTSIDGKDATVVTLTTQKGATIRMYFDAATGLLVRDEVPNDGLVQTTDHGDYRDVNGMKYAFYNRITIDGAVFEVRYDEIKINPAIARSEFDFPKMPGEPLPEIASLLQDVQANQEKVEGLLDTYSYTQKFIQRELGKDGVLRETESQTYQLSFYKGRRMTRMIEKNGKPLSVGDQADEDKKAAKRVEDIEKDIAKQEKREKSGQPPPENEQRISIAEMLRASTLSNPRRERFRGRDVIVFDFEPNPAFDYKNAKSMLKFFGKTAGAMWIDDKDKQVARVEAFLADSFNIGGGLVAKLKKGASFTLEQERVNDEIWLPSVADINLSVRVFLVKGINLNQVIRSYDYRKFETEVKDARVNPAN